MSYPNPRYDPSRRRRNRHASTHHGSPLARIATTAAVAYGAYQLGAWAWNAYFGDGVKDEESDEYEEGDYAWTDDRQSQTIKSYIRHEEGFSSESGGEETDEDSSRDDNGKQLRRSRRSRLDWSDSHERSNSPSPIKVHHRTNIEEEGTEDPDGDGMVKQGMKKAASMASTGLGTAVSVGISAGIHAYNKNNQASNNDSILDQERQVRMGRCRLETSRAMMDFLPTLKKAVAKETDVSLEMKELKTLRIRKKELLEMKQDGDDGAVDMEDEEDSIREKERCLWNEIKNKSITRLVTTVYAHTIIYLVLTVQVNLLGGRLLREEQEENDSMMGHQHNAALGSDRYRTSHQTVLAKTYHYLFAKGIPSLAESVGKELKGILQQWDVLGDDVSLRDVSTWIETVRSKMEQRQQTEGMSPLMKFVVPPEGEAHPQDNTGTTDELASYILDETYDLLESPTFANTERQCLDATFAQLRMKVLGKLFLLEESMPLVNVVTHLQKTAVSTFHKPPSHKEEMKNWGGVFGMMEEPLPSVPNEYIPKLERLDAVIELSDICF